MVHYDPFSPEVMRDPWPVYARLREEAPAYYLERWDAWALSRFADLWDAAGDPQTFLARRGTSTAHLLTKVMSVAPMIGVMDPPDHTRLRAAVRGCFAARRVAGFESRIRGWVSESLQRVHERGKADLVAEFAQVGQVVEAFSHVEIHRIVDRGLGAKGVLLFEILLYV